MTFLLACAPEKARPAAWQRLCTPIHQDPLLPLVLDDRQPLRWPPNPGPCPISLREQLPPRLKPGGPAGFGWLENSAGATSAAPDVPAAEVLVPGGGCPDALHVVHLDDAPVREPWVVPRRRSSSQGVLAAESPIVKIVQQIRRASLPSSRVESPCHFLVAPAQTPLKRPRAAERRFISPRSGMRCTT